MFKMLRMLLCCVTNGLLKISKVYSVICFCKRSNLLNIDLYEYNMHFLISYLLKLDCYFYKKRTSQAVYRKPATDNLVHHGFSRPQNMPMSHNSKQNLLPGGATISKNSPHISDWPLDHCL